MRPFRLNEYPIRLKLNSRDQWRSLTLLFVYNERVRDA